MASGPNSTITKARCLPFAVGKEKIQRQVNRVKHGKVHSMLVFNSPSRRVALTLTFPKIYHHTSMGEVTAVLMRDSLV